MKTECSMVITADFLISNVRTCQKEDRWCDALSLLHEGLMDFTVLVSAKLSKFTGKIVFENSAKITDKDILILPNANVKYESQALKAGLVIVETGSALSHLVMLNKNIEVAPLCILRMKDAITKFKDCASLKIDFEKKTIIGRYHA